MKVIELAAQLCTLETSKFLFFLFLLINRYLTYMINKTSGSVGHDAYMRQTCAPLTLELLTARNCAVIPQGQINYPIFQSIVQSKNAMI